MSHDDREDRREDRHEREEIRLEREENRLLRKQIDLLEQILAAIESNPNQPVLTRIRILLQGGAMPVAPLTIAVGQAYVATVIGFDQNGAPFTGPIPAATFAVADSTVASIDATAGTGTGLAAGSTGVSGSLTTAEGLALSDTETLTVTAVAPVLTSIKVSLDATASVAAPK